MHVDRIRTISDNRIKIVSKEREKEIEREKEDIFSETSSIISGIPVFGERCVRHSVNSGGGK